jgi:hypothetical protein
MVVERQEAVHEAERKNAEETGHQGPEPAQEAGQEQGGDELAIQLPAHADRLWFGIPCHPQDRFLTLLVQHEIEALVDIRRFPGSRKHPHFSRDNLAAALPKSGVEYHWLEALGRRRHKQRDESPNLGLENAGFRNYADYMLTEEFQEGLEELLNLARRKRTAIMCAEGLFWQCHRRLVSDFLAANGVSVQHIMPSGELRPHKMTSGVVFEGGRVTYPGERSLFS